MKGFGIFLVALGLSLIVGGLIFSSVNTTRCEERGGVMMSGQCVKAERIPL